MTTVSMPGEDQASGEVGEVFADIRRTFGMPFVPNLFKVMAHNPAYLKASWERVKVIMGPGLIDRKTKEMIAVAVSAANGCDYCVLAHTAALKSMGVGDGEIVELMAVVDLFSGFNSGPPRNPLKAISSSMQSLVHQETLGIFSANSLGVGVDEVRCGLAAT